MESSWGQTERTGGCTVLRAKQQTRHDTHFSDLLISILIRFPEIMSINLDLPRERCKFTFMLHGKVTKDNFSSFKSILTGSLATYGELTDTEYNIKSDFSRSGPITLIGISCGTAELSLELIHLITALVEAEFAALVLRDPETAEACRDEELLRQEELIEYLLAQPGGRRANLIAFREAGKVYVYNK
jgi:hypothetical protein